MKKVFRSALELIAFCYLAMMVFALFIMAFMRWNHASEFSTRGELLVDCLMHALLWPVYLPMYLFSSGSL